MSENVVAIRGVIQHRQRAQQLVDFRDLRFGEITPTDLDGLIEYKNRCFLLIELKHISKANMPGGQRLGLERLCMALKKPALLLHALHDKPVHEDIDAAGAIVHRYFWRGAWQLPPYILTVREAAEGFFEKYGTPGR